MTTSESILRTRPRLTMLMALLLLSSTLAAQTTETPAPSAVPSASVTINARKGETGDPHNVIAAKSKILSRKFGSSCAFMSGYSAADDDLMLSYMSHFNMEDSSSNEATRLREFSPQGDVSTIIDPTSIDTGAPAIDDPNAPAVKCGKADNAFAAGRNYIERKDKSLGEGFVAFDNEQYPQALALFNTAYNKVGYDEASLMLGKMHLYGMGTPKNTAEAVAWFKKTVDVRFDPRDEPVGNRMQFNPRMPGVMSPRAEACMTLAKIYMLGMGTKKDPAEVRKWYAKAAESGYAPADNNLGLAYLNGYGGEKSAVKARDYLKDGAEAGYVPAEYNLARLYYVGDGGVPKDLKLAGAYFAAAAKAGNVGAMFAAGRMYDLGEGVAVDQNRAIVYYKEAAVKGNPDAQSALATYFYTGQQVPRDLDTARKLFSTAATAGQVDAMFNLAVMLAQGEGGPKNLTLAYVWLSLAKASGHASAGDALKEVAPLLSAREHADADAILKPKS